MKLLIDLDNTIAANREAVINLFNNPSNNVEAFLPLKRFHIPTSMLISAEINLEFAKKSSEGVAAFDAAIFFTMTPYENNFFFEDAEDHYVVSLSGWNNLTRIEIDVGIAYFICLIALKYVLGIGENHHRNTGCINDFLWDKTGISSGMRAAYICDRCKTVSSGKTEYFSREIETFEEILDRISGAARSGRRILDLLEEPPQHHSLDLFLCHNSEDKSDVRKLNEFLKNGGMKTWFDEDKIDPSMIWQDELEKEITSIKGCAVIVGENGMGPWQKFEQRAFINEFLDRGAIVIPVLIGGMTTVPKLPIFLKQFHYLDLREENFTNAVKLFKLFPQLKKP